MIRMEVDGMEEKMLEEIGDTGLEIILGSFPFPVSERSEQGSSSFERGSREMQGHVERKQ